MIFGFPYDIGVIVVYSMLMAYLVVRLADTIHQLVEDKEEEKHD